MSASNVDISGGVLSGNGTVGGPTHIAATLSAGADSSAGILNFLDFSEFSGIIKVEIAGLLVDGASPDASVVNVGSVFGATEFDQYNVFSTASLENGLDFQIFLLNGFVPTEGDFFDVFTAFDLIANLSLLDFLLPDLGANIRFDESIVNFGDRAALRLTVVATNVPEPGTLPILCFGVLAAIFVTRRRRRPAPSSAF